MAERVAVVKEKSKIILKVEKSAFYKILAKILMSKNTVIILAEFPTLNPDRITPIPGLSLKYTGYLNSLLISNWVELIYQLNESIEPFFLFNELDKEFIPKNLTGEKFNCIFYLEESLKNLYENILKKLTSENSKTLIIFYNSIGLKQSDISRIFNLIQTEESSLVIGKSNRDRIVFSSSNSIDKNLTDPLLITKRKYEEYLGLITVKDIFIHTMGGFLSIDDFEDIKNLYIELSKKESLLYCSQKMHESFNDLFIEYKELLNV